MAASAEDFQKELRGLLKQAESLGFVAVEVSSGNLHRRIGGYPGVDHRMPICCEVMHSEIKPGDVIVAQPDSGKGARVVIRYRLPR